MTFPTAVFIKRLPVTPQRQPLTFVVYSEDEDLREVVAAAIGASRKYGEKRDRIVEIATPEEARALTLDVGACVLLDAGSRVPPEDLLLDSSPSTTLVLVRREGKGADAFAEELLGRFIFDDELSLPAKPVRVDTMIRRLRELVFLRRRTFQESSGVPHAEKFRRLNRIGAALSEIHHLGDLLDVVLTEARNIMDADAGSIYTIERGSHGSWSGRKVLGRAQRMTRAVAVKRSDLASNDFSLRFAAAQNDSMEIPFEEIIFPANLESIAGYAALTGETVIISDVYELPEGATYRFNKEVIDAKYGYRTCSMLTVPLKNTNDDVVGVVQLINKKTDPLRKLDKGEKAIDWIVPFTDEDVELAASLGGQAGVAIENVRLMDAITRLFESFVHASVRAIEQRDPTTAGHSGRVDRITMALAAAVNDATEGPFKDECFDDAQAIELHYAGLLHDFGKIGVREHVLTKAEKLYPAQSQAIAFRGEIIRRELQLEALEKGAELARNGSTDPQAIRDALDAKLASLDSDLEFIVEHTKPVFMTDENLERMARIYDSPYRIRGEIFLLIDKDEHYSLQTRRGTLNSEERKEIESHVSHSWRFLKQIPWTDDLAAVPEIAGQHHEKMNGKGYPGGVPAAQTPLGSRLMAVADVFDSLTASDRPYKPAIPLERALEILARMSDGGELDPNVVNLFNDAKIWEKLKLKVLRIEDATDEQKAAR